MAIEKAKGKYPFKYTFISVFVFAIISLSVIASVILKDVNSIEIESNIRLVVNDGWGLNRCAERLYEEEIIKYPRVFEFIAKTKGLSNSVQPGQLEINPGMSYSDILGELVKVNRDAVKITIPEGYEVRQIAEALVEANLIDKEVFYSELKPELYNYRFLESIPQRDNPLEGYLFPTTYYFSPMFTERQIIDEMLREFDKHFAPEYYDRAQELGMSVDEIVTLASIVEREARSEEDRGMISGVFHNRLKLPMRLQSCATVQYILKERKEKLSKRDTQIKSPYNTYINDGLPIGPIASPGVDCIEAALYPETTDALYFVLGSDGKHIFSVEFEDHVSAKQN